MNLADFIDTSEGWSLTRLAAELNISHEGARLIVRGRRKAGPETARRIVELTGGKVGFSQLRPDRVAAVHAAPPASDEAA